MKARTRKQPAGKKLITADTPWADWKQLWDAGCPKPEGYPATSDDYRDMVHMAAIRWLLDRGWQVGPKIDATYTLFLVGVATQESVEHVDLDRALRDACHF